MNINTSFTLPQSDNAQPRSRVNSVDKDAPDSGKNNAQASQRAVVVAPDEVGSDNAQAYQQFVREDNKLASQHAIASYLSFEKQEKRESVQAMFGVDVYA